MGLFLSEAHGSAPGSAISAARLVDLILVQAIRFWLVQQPACVGGWLGAMRDPHVGAALAKLHADPAHAWTVDELSQQVGLSRSPLAARFTTLVGEPPLRYLTRVLVPGFEISPEHVAASSISNDTPTVDPNATHQAAENEPPPPPEHKSVVEKIEDKVIAVGKLISNTVKSIL